MASKTSRSCSRVMSACRWFDDGGEVLFTAIGGPDVLPAPTENDGFPSHGGGGMFIELARHDH